MVRRGGEAAARRLRRQNERRARSGGTARDAPRRLIVLDASLAVDLLAESGRSKAAIAAVGSKRIAVPAHFDAEVYGVFRRLFRQDLLERARFDLITARLIAFAAERIALPTLLPRAHQLADRIAAPDSFYVALSELMRARLLTADAHLSSAATGIVEVQFVGAG